ncbi:unnamed protein product [Timema podura]|uniref:Uncharacterized protein n=1 Tax=Timema podura TaxID=61482 RepID=A0ABN7NPA8_TIMPD|nr:unnamed protein product [Timema podura]
MANQSAQVDKKPTSTSLKYDVKIWLRENSIPFTEEMRKPQFIELVKRVSCERKYKIEDINKDKVRVNLPRSAALQTSVAVTFCLLGILEVHELVDDATIRWCGNILRMEGMGGADNSKSTRKELGGADNNKGTRKRRRMKTIKRGREDRKMETFSKLTQP